VTHFTWISKTLIFLLAVSSLWSNPSKAGDQQAVWVSNAQGSWFDPNNWVDALTPASGRNVRFGVSSFEDPLDEVDIDNDGGSIVQPGDMLIVNDKVRFFDGSAAGDPSLADDGLIFDAIRLDGQGGEAVIVDVPLTARSIRSSRHGAILNREITVTEILAQSEHQDRWQINAGATHPVARLLLDENRGPDGDTIDGQFAVNSSLQVAHVDQVWGRLVVASDVTLSVDRYVHYDYTDQPEHSNINPIRIDGTLSVDRFTVFSVATETVGDLPPGLHGRIGHPSAEFEQVFISGDGLLIVVGDSLFNDRFESTQP